MEIKVKTGSLGALQSFMDSDAKIVRIQCRTQKSVHNEFNKFAIQVRKHYKGRINLHQRGTDLYIEKA